MSANLHRRSIRRYVDVEVSLDEFDTKDLIEELRNRHKDGDVSAGNGLSEDAAPAVQATFDAYGRGNMRQLDEALRDLFDIALGRVAGHSPLLEIA